MRRTAWRRPGLAALGAAIALIACAPAARTAPRVEAVPVMAPIHPRDMGCAVVTVENDGDARRVTLRAQRTVGDEMREVTPITEMALDLAPAARKRVWLPIAPGGETHAAIWLEDDGDVLATTAIDFGYPRYDHVAIAPLGVAPQRLVVLSREELPIDVLTLETERLPSRAEHWPALAAVVWDEPRSTTLLPAQARALREHVLAGGRLVAGVTEEEPDALATIGFDDLSGGSRASLPVENAVAIAHGLGTIVLVPRPLSQVAAASWSALVGVEPVKEDDERQFRPDRDMKLHGFMRELMPDIAPRPPIRKAAFLLSAFFLAAVPLDAWLTRRTLKRGARSRFGALRFPAFVLIATIAAFFVAGGFGGEDRRLVRLDIIDVGPDGRGTGQSQVYLARGRSGVVDVESEGSLGIPLIAAFAYYGDTRGPRGVRLEASADASLPSSRVRLATTPWEPVVLSMTWTPEEIPVVTGSASDPGGLVLPPCDDARIGVHLPFVAPQWNLPSPGWTPVTRPAGEPPEPLVATAIGLVTASEPPGKPIDLVLAFRKRLGPEMRIDGLSTDGGRVVSLVRYRFAPASPPPETTK